MAVHAFGRNDPLVRRSSSLNWALHGVCNRRHDWRFVVYLPEVYVCQTGSKPSFPLSSSPIWHAGQQQFSDGDAADMRLGFPILVWPLVAAPFCPACFLIRDRKNEAR
jgi:hypothetical protein